MNFHYIKLNVYHELLKSQVYKLEIYHRALQNITHRPITTPRDTITTPRDTGPPLPGVTINTPRVCARLQ